MTLVLSNRSSSSLIFDDIYPQSNNLTTKHLSNKNEQLIQHQEDRLLALSEKHSSNEPCDKNQPSAPPAHAARPWCPHSQNNYVSSHIQMSSGLTRRRGAGGGGGENEDGDPSRVNSPAPKAGPSRDSAPETSYESSENGHKIAFDPRDISESAERSKQPKLTLMEEVLLLGLKDKQVRGLRFIE